MVKDILELVSADGIGKYNALYQKDKVCIWITGVWSLNYKNSRINIMYTGASMSYTWTFMDDDGDYWPHYDPNRTVYGALTASDPFGNHIFYSGLMWKDPNY